MYDWSLYSFCRVSLRNSTGNTLRQRQRGHWGGRPSHRTAYFRNEVETRNKLSENHLQPLVDLCISIDWTSREVGHNVELCLMMLIFIWWSWSVFTFPLTILKMPPRPRVSDGQASARISRMHVTWDQDKCGGAWLSNQVLWSSPALTADLQDRTWLAGWDEQVPENRIPGEISWVMPFHRLTSFPPLAAWSSRKNRPRREFLRCASPGGRLISYFR